MRTEDNNGLVIARLTDAMEACKKRNYPCFIGFLNESEISSAVKYLTREHFSGYRLFGGYENSERCMLGISSNSEYIEDYYYPLCGISFRYKKEYKLGHRDFLGSLMSLGIKREAVGDILTGEGETVIFVKRELRDYIITQISKIGGVGVSAQEWNGGCLPRKCDFENLVFTVSSARLDNIVSAVLSLGREKSAEQIRQGRVFVNSAEAVNVSRILKEGDKISVRGYGKFLLKGFSGLTKKGRLKINIKKYK